SPTARADSMAWVSFCCLRCGRMIIKYRNKAKPMNMMKVNMPPSWLPPAAAVWAWAAGINSIIHFLQSVRHAGNHKGVILAQIVFHNLRGMVGKSCIRINGGFFYGTFKPWSDHLVIQPPSHVLRPR